VQEDVMGSWRDIDHGWELTVADEPPPPDVPENVRGGVVPATVPGCVHTDLLAANLIPDPYLDQNEHALRWIGRTRWRYATRFAGPPSPPGESERVDLVCEGLDTIATITLNDEVVGATQNMHRSYRFDVTHLIRSEANDLVITFDSAERYAREQRDRLGDRPGPNSATPEPFNFVRKMACNFGWDWGPVLVTAGIWKPIRLHTWHTARLAQVRPLVSVTGSAGTSERSGAVGRVQVIVEVERVDPEANVGLRVTATVAGVQGQVDIGAGVSSATVELEVPDVELWWPHGLGDQPLYDLTVTLASASTGDVLDTWTRRIGFRTVRLDTTPDDIGSAFTIVVNDVPIFARGANWIPDDCFPSRVDRSRYQARLHQAKDAGINLLRVWGGGIYEQDAFYDVADELGILVWQDFLFACAAYPEEPPFAGEVEAEARENVARLMPHPSLVLWNGNNENIWGWFDWGWRSRLDDRTWGKGYYVDLLARVVDETDPTRPYWPGSPYSGSFDIHPNADEFGCSHVWDVWNERDYTGYRDYVPRFVAEFGWQGPPAWATLTRAVHDDPLTPDSPALASHQKAVDGNGKLARGLAPHFDEPQSFDDWHWLTQLNQARAAAYGIEHFRSHRGRCMGTVIWQLNDCWPVISWAAIDGDGRRKPLWYALRRVYDPRLLTVQPREGSLVVIAVNEDREPWTADVAIERRTFAGEVLGRHEAKLEIAGGSTNAVKIPADVATASDPSSEVLVVSVADEPPMTDSSGHGQLHRRAWWFYAEDKNLAYPEPDVDVSVSQDLRTGTAEVSVTARSFVRDLAVFADRLDPGAEADDMLVTLFPGESHTFRIAGLGRPIVPADVSSPPVLRSAGDTRR